MAFTLFWAFLACFRGWPPNMNKYQISGLGFPYPHNYSLHKTQRESDGYVTGGYQLRSIVIIRIPGMANTGCGATVSYLHGEYLIIRILLRLRRDGIPLETEEDQNHNQVNHWALLTP